MEATVPVCLITRQYLKLCSVAGPAAATKIVDWQVVRQCQEQDLISYKGSPEIPDLLG